MAYIKGNFETLGSNFSHEIEGLLVSIATIKKSILLTLFNIISIQTETTSYSSIGNISQNGLYYWKNQDLGLIFSHETEGLLASITTVQVISF